MRQSYTYLTPSKKEEIKQEQKGICAICFRDTEPLVIDHEHTTDFVRQALCVRCNNGLGCFEDDWDILLRAACYVIVHKAGLSDLRIGYRLLFDEAQKQMARQLANAKREAKKQLCQQVLELKQEELASVDEAIHTAKPAVRETST